MWLIYTWCKHGDVDVVVELFGIKRVLKHTLFIHFLMLTFFLNEKNILQWKKSQASKMSCCPNKNTER